LPLFIHVDIPFAFTENISVHNTQYTFTHNFITFLYYSLLFLSTGRPPIFRRSLATEVSYPPPPPPTTTTQVHPGTPPRPKLHTAVILNRSPILTRTPTSFESAYYAYQARLQRALHNPFPYDFYFKPGSLLESKFNLEERQRDRKAFGPGFGADHRRAPGAGLTAQDLKKFGRDEDETPAPRVHSSDVHGDVKSLDRNGQQNLYLLIQQRTSPDAAATPTAPVWKFPEIAVAGNELLHEVSGHSHVLHWHVANHIFSSLQRVI
jgi:large subunit ribosomal protein L46